MRAATQALIVRWIEMSWLVAMVLTWAAVPSARADQASDAGHSQTAAAAKQVHDARAAVSQVQVKLNRLRNLARADVQAKPEWAPVFGDLKKALAACDAAKKVVLAKLEKDPKFRALRAERQKAQYTLAASDSGDASVSDRQIDQATKVIFDDGLKIRQLESAALDNDEKHSEAKANLDAARSRMDQFDAEVTTALERMPEYQQLQQELASAQQQVESARQQLAQAAQAERDAREQAERSREEQAAQGQ